MVIFPSLEMLNERGVSGEAAVVYSTMNVPYAKEMIEAGLFRVDGREDIEGKDAVFKVVATFVHVVNVDAV